jgi:hypothetical protein
MRPNRPLGFDEFGWSYSALEGMRRHIDSWIPYGGKCKVGDIIGCGIDLRRHVVFFTRNGKELGRFDMGMLDALLIGLQAMRSRAFMGRFIHTWRHRVPASSSGLILAESRSYMRRRLWMRA